MSVADAASAAPTLSVVMPVYNEMKTLRAIVEAVRAVEIDKEIVLVDDGSKDGSRDLVQQLAQEFDNVRAVLHPQNMGKGAAAGAILGAITGLFVGDQNERNFRRSR
jgi:glycosyltransferase involved in cell wall biosynthesis